MEFYIKTEIYVFLFPRNMTFRLQGYLVSPKKFIFSFFSFFGVHFWPARIWIHWHRPNSITHLPLWYTVQ
jgi:hypothetical protein